jgi:hypothetical protein
MRQLSRLVVVALAVAMLCVSSVEAGDEYTSELVWEGKTFRAGTAKPNETGNGRELVIEAGRTGVMVRGEPVQVVRVRWDAQEWTDWETGKKVRAPSFESTCHVSYLEVVEPRE